MPNPLTKTMATSISAYGFVEVSRPIAAALLGFSLKALNRRIMEGQIEVAGRIKKMISVADIERLTGRPVTVHGFLSAMAAQTRNAHRKDERRAPIEGASCHVRSSI
jgi:hypothetical protein